MKPAQKKFQRLTKKRTELTKHRKPKIRKRLEELETQLQSLQKAIERLPKKASNAVPMRYSAILKTPPPITNNSIASSTLYEIQFEKYDAQKTELEHYEFKGVYLVLWKNRQKIGYITPKKLELLLGEEYWIAFQTWATIFCIYHE